MIFSLQFQSYTWFASTITSRWNDFTPANAARSEYKQFPSAPAAFPTHAQRQQQHGHAIPSAAPPSNARTRYEWWPPSAAGNKKFIMHTHQPLPPSGMGDSGTVHTLLCTNSTVKLDLTHVWKIQATLDVEIVIFVYYFAHITALKKSIAASFYRVWYPSFFDDVSRAAAS